MAEARRVCPICGAAYGGDALFCPRDGAPLASRKSGGAGDPYVGLTIEGRIRLDRLAGIGSMGRVYRAHQSGIERPVAVKILHPEHAKNATLVARFQREGRVAGGLAHPHVVTIHAAGELPRSTAQPDGEPYLVMEYLDGLSLRSALAAGGGALPLERALRIMLQVSDAMGEAHAHGVVHRDLKPENVMLVARGADPDFVKVLDFGIARIGEADTSVATHAGAVLGTATYACPESARGDRVGPEGDVYSIATLLFECLAGRPPFEGAGPVDVLIQHAHAPAPDLRSLTESRHVPAAIADLVSQNLAKSPTERAPDGRVFGRALLEAAARSTPAIHGLVAASTLLGLEQRPSRPPSLLPAPPPRDPGPTTQMATSVASGERKTLRDLGTGGRPQ